MFKHKTSIQIRFNDLDKLGHVNNANHLTYIELARTKYFEDVIGGKIDWNKNGVILARVEVDYKLPILFEDDVLVFTRVGRMGSKSFDMNFEIVKVENSLNVVLASGKAVIVCFDYTQGKTAAVPEHWKEKVFNYEPEPPVSL